VYHSEVPSEGEAHACGCALLPLNTKTRGPAKRTEGAPANPLRRPNLPRCAAAVRSRCVRHAGRDIIDEALEYFRANVLFRKYDVKGARSAHCAQPAPARD
jgi:actin related protein 2/3 complex subunit 3